MASQAALTPKPEAPLATFSADETGSVFAVNMRHPEAADLMLAIIRERRAMFPPQPRFSLADIQAMGAPEQLASLAAQLAEVR